MMTKKKHQLPLKLIELLIQRLPKVGEIEDMYSHNSDVSIIEFNGEHGKQNFYIEKKDIQDNFNFGYPRLSIEEDFTFDQLITKFNLENNLFLVEGVDYEPSSSHFREHLSNGFIHLKINEESVFYKGDVFIKIIVNRETDKEVNVCLNNEIKIIAQLLNKIFIIQDEGNILVQLSSQVYSFINSLKLENCNLNEEDIDSDEIRISSDDSLSYFHVFNIKGFKHPVKVRYQLKK